MTLDDDQPWIDECATWFCSMRDWPSNGDVIHGLLWAAFRAGRRGDFAAIGQTHARLLAELGAADREVGTGPRVEAVVRESAASAPYGAQVLREGVLE